MSREKKGPRNRGSNSALSRLRLAAGLTQAQLAQKIGCGVNEIGRWEQSGVTPRPQTLAKIAKVLNCSMEELLDSEE